VALLLAVDEAVDDECADEWSLPALEARVSADVSVAIDMIVWLCDSGVSSKGRTYWKCASLNPRVKEGCGLR